MIITTSNKKIPYPTEGVIRSAQINDTVSPDQSAELAVNMNFDCIGAVKTRKGVSEYATQVAEEISNFGKLNNFVIPDGYSRITQIGSEGEFSSQNIYDISVAKYDATHVIVFWRGTDDDGYAQVMEVDANSGGVTPIGTALEFDTADAKNNRCIQVDSTHFLNIWTGTANDGFAQVFTVNPSTYAVTANGSAFEYDTSNGEYPTVAQVDSSHFIVFYTGASNTGKAVVLAVNLTTYAVTAAGAVLTFDAVFNIENSCAALDGTHFINFWSGSSGGKCQMFEVNTGTWAITALSSAFTMDPTGIADCSVIKVDSSHFIAFWQGFKAGGLQGIAQVFAVNLSTYAITEPDTYITYSSSSGIGNSAVSVGDGVHFVNFWEGASYINYSAIFAVNTSTWAVTETLPAISLGLISTSSSFNNAAVKMADYRIYNFWKNDDSTGVGAAFKTQGTPVQGNYLYAQVDDIVQNWNGSSWTTRRSSLATVSKARFSQFLNRIWMVNGNSAIGGDPVMTSNGGAFDSTLVPTDFPSGDFIHAGFEGRVWVADKAIGIIYYTDIVQFTPPDVYTLEYDPQVNYIKDISPQDGESITALFRVPRALLVFTENHIFRIYGATSIDSYPAYNVGTYSQESIIETKTGIFFHHSSGFYQFDYGGQPVEISRRIIDFVQAIPRSSYDDIVGVYDGFDAVEWAVGSVTVDGITFSSCVLRYTISTQVWTVYNYDGNTITAMILYDDGTNQNCLMGTSTGLVGKMNDGNTDFGEAINYEYIDRWRNYTDIYAKVNNINGFNIYAENAAGAQLSYQVKKSGPNVWTSLGEASEAVSSILPNANTEDFNVARFRITGRTKGPQVVFNGLELLTIQDKGYDAN